MRFAHGYTCQLGLPKCRQICCCWAGSFLVRKRRIFDRTARLPMHSSDCALLRRHSQAQKLSSGLHLRCPGLQQLSRNGLPRACPASRPAQPLQTRAAVQAPPAPLEVKSFEGDSAGSAELSLKVAPSQTAKGLVHRYVTYVLQNARAGTASTKTRAEVRGGGQKPYQQKKTGRARQGSKRTPLRPGGGIIFGPKPRDWSIRMNKKERRLALSTALQSASDAITVIEDVGDKLGTPRTRELTAALQRWGVSLEEKTLLILDKPNEQVTLAGQNVAKLHINTAQTLEVYRILNADRIVIERSALNYIHDFYGNKDAEPEVVAELNSESAAEVPAESPAQATAEAAADAPAAEGAETPAEALSD